MREINKDYFCSGNNYVEGWCSMADAVHTDTCSNCKHKHPTPIQFKYEYGLDVPDAMPVWYIDSDDPREQWTLDFYANAVDDQRYKIIIACTPFVPDNEWRPK